MTAPTPSRTRTAPAVAPAGTPWLRRFHTAPAGAPRLLVLPHAGGNASYFFPLSTALARHADTLVVQYPGRQERFGEPCVESLHDMADLVAAVLLADSASLLDRPLAVFGHSMGASLAFEVACRLRDAGFPPAALTVSGRRAPSIPAPGAVHLADDGQLIADMKLLGGTDERMLDHPELLAAVLPSVRSDYVATETYRFRGAAPLDCPITALIGDVDPRVDEPQARAWHTHTTAAFRLRSYAGGHFFLVPHLDAVVSELRSHLPALP
ncbi:thioesterase II family protein [Streptomyces tropicalis]|uniref:Alpha/beta fold hydrolase n=1 Tax=Streptomyces tropicalis TaxID=3034234 RepID=A0ABT6AAH8_9ACTN|nr:alpha/beta fold hydrolase [Streptomyces tropicalis]MDF3300830.1 alpha/beta fold hydrolase [Streptomyces tropicalis]